MNRFNKFLKKKKSEKSVGGSPKNASVITARSKDRRRSLSLFENFVCVLCGTGLKPSLVSLGSVFVVQILCNFNHKQFLLTSDFRASTQSSLVSL